MGTTLAPLICPQGHGPGVPGAQFCTACGGQLVAAAAPVAQVMAVQPMPAPPPAVAAPQPMAAPPPIAVAAPAGQGWTPVNQAPAPAQAWTPPPAGAIPMAVPQQQNVKNGAAVCATCGGAGSRLDAAENVCAGCGWLRPLLPGYQLDRSVFLWAQDGQAMTQLQKISALHAVVKSVSDKVGRPWIESTFNGIRLGPRQLPDVWKQAVLAARILGLPSMPDVYVSGDQQWNTYTYGTDTSSFIVLGTAILTNFQNDELLFMLAREMGHCRAGHALWKTVSRFLAGDVGVHSGLLSNGVLNAISPTKLIEGAIEMPLMAWSRQSDVTADRAGLLAVGDEALARRVLLAWSIRSARLLKQVNIEEWMKQEDASSDNMTRFSEMTTSATMYTTRRLRLLGQAAREPELVRWSQSIQPIRAKLAPAPAPQAKAAVPLAPTSRAAAPQAGQAAKPDAPKEAIRVLCNKCQTAVRIPLTVLRGKTSLNVRCPQCHNVFTLRQKPAPAAATQTAVPPPAAVAEPVATPAAQAGTKQVPVPATAGRKQAKPPVTAGAAN